MKLVSGKLYKVRAYDWGAYHPSYGSDNSASHVCLLQGKIIMYVQTTEGPGKNKYDHYVHWFLCPDLKMRCLKSDKKDKLFSYEDNNKHLAEIKK